MHTTQGIKQTTKAALQISEMAIVVVLNCRTTETRVELPSLQGLISCSDYLKYDEESTF